jgi:deazaflavin-dependent oxidoreductase (nitroreductase family)
MQEVILRKENDMAEPYLNDWNRQIIEEFRTNGGEVGGPFEGATLLLLTTTGARSGQQRISPLSYLLDGERLFIFAGNAGSPTHPDWYYNLVAHPHVIVEVGTERFEATAAPVSGEKRDQIWASQVQRLPGIAAYQKKTTRKIPVVELVRRNDS